MQISQEQLSLAVYSLRKTGFRHGMYIFITGCDDAAYALGVLASHCGAAGVTFGALNRNDEEKMERLGLSCFVYGRDNLETAKKQTNGRLYDLVFETTGNVVAYDSFIDMVKRGGVVGILARLDEAYSFFVKTAVRSQIRFVGLRSFDEQSAKIAKDMLARNWKGLM